VVEVREELGNGDFVVGLCVSVFTGGEGGGGTADGPGVTVALGAPTGTLLSGVGATPLRYASAQRITVFT
jgi:hypothetical protein